MMDKKRFLIVNADDFGQSAGVNRGVILAHEQGILTSASLMVRWPRAQEAAEYAQEHPELSVGIHLDFGEWAFRNGDWVSLYSVADERNAAAIQRETTTQLEVFRQLMGRDPTHIDSHQHRHENEPVRSVVHNLARTLGVPVRNADPRVQYCGRFYGQCNDGTPWPEGIEVDALIGILHELKPGFTELGCHPAAVADLDTMYCWERPKELETLCDSRVRDAIDAMGVKLCSFATLICEDVQ